MADNCAEIDKAHTFSCYVFELVFILYHTLNRPSISNWFRFVFHFSDFLGRLQPSKTTIQKTRGTLRVEESSYPRKVLHFYSSNSSRGRMRAEFCTILSRSQERSPPPGLRPQGREGRGRLVAVPVLGVDRQGQHRQRAAVGGRFHASAGNLSAAWNEISSSFGERLRSELPHPFALKDRWLVRVSSENDRFHESCYYSLGKNVNFPIFTDFYRFFGLSWETSPQENLTPEASKQSGSGRIEFSSKSTTFLM